MPNATGAVTTRSPLPGFVPAPTKSPALMLDFLNARTDMRRKAGKIYGVIVTQARRPSFYADLGVPDTPAGRYEMVVVHLVLVLERLRSAPGAGAAAAAPAGGSVHCRHGRFLARDGHRRPHRSQEGSPRRHRALRAQRGLPGGPGGERRGGLGGRAQGAHVRRRRRAICALGSPATCRRRRRHLRQRTPKQIAAGSFEFAEVPH